jgi:hypothetical protein
MANLSPSLRFCVSLLIAGCLCRAAAADLPLVPGQAPNSPPASVSMELPPEVTVWFRNPDGSCVQCSNGMVGVHNNLPAWTTLLWDTEYGSRQRGGSGPSRVANYARARGMRIYNVTGSKTFAWMDWAAKTGRFAAIGAGSNHFQTLYGRNFAAERWYVCNNNSTSKVDVYDANGFRSLHLRSGTWIVVPDEPACPPAPRIVAWWQ